jgi:hypothetical protein
MGVETNEKDSHIGNLGWGLLIGGVVLWDLLAEETLSSAADRYLRHPVGKYAAIGAVAVTASHLLNLPEHFGVPDPIIKGLDLLERARDGIRKT